VLKDISLVHFGPYHGLGGGTAGGAGGQIGWIRAGHDALGRHVSRLQPARLLLRRDAEAQVDIETNV
jgi:hypothetical protein